MSLPSSIVVDRRLTVWLGSLAALAALNAVVWILIAGSVSLDSTYTQAQLLLSGVYVGVCAFRSLFPRVDLERACVWDTWLSGILLGRTAATVAELCFAVQCALTLRRLSENTGMPLLDAGAAVFLPVAIVAEIVCWYAVLSLNHIGHAIEESLWSVLMLLLSAACGVAMFAAHGTLQAMLIAGFVIYGIAAGLTLVIDVRMYLQRWWRHAASRRLAISTGLRDSWHRRHPTLAWDDWREEVPWMTLYFSVGVWTSLAMVLLA